MPLSNKIIQNYKKIDIEKQISLKKYKNTHLKTNRKLANKTRAHI